MNKWENENGGAGPRGRQKDGSLSFYQLTGPEETRRTRVTSEKKEERKRRRTARRERPRDVAEGLNDGEAFNLSPGTMPLR